MADEVVGELDRLSRSVGESSGDALVFADPHTAGPKVERRYRYPGRKRVPDRAALTGILFVLKTGIPWEHLPQEMGCGSGMTCWRRLRVLRDVESSGASPGAPDARPRARLTCRQAPQLVQRSRSGLSIRGAVTITHTPTFRRKQRRARICRTVPCPRSEAGPSGVSAGLRGSATGEGRERRELAVKPLPGRAACWTGRDWLRHGRPDSRELRRLTPDGASKQHSTRLLCRRDTALRGC